MFPTRCHLWVFLFNVTHFWGSLAFLKYAPDVFVSTWQRKAKPFVGFLKIISHSFPVKSLFILSHRAVTNHPHLAELCSRASLTCCRSTTAVQPSVSTWNELQLKAVQFFFFFFCYHLQLEYRTKFPLWNGSEFFKVLRLHRVTCWQREFTVLNNWQLTEGSKGAEEAGEGTS